MMEVPLLSIITAQTEILHANIEETINAVMEDNLYDVNICDWTIGEQLFHMLHSMDQWFINPDRYEEPEIAFRWAECNGRLSKSELVEYFNLVKAKTTNYLEGLSLESLVELPPDCRFSRLALIQGQYRHIMYHIGLIHGCLRVRTGGESPAYVGLGPPVGRGK